MLNIAVLVSGGGTNLQALIDSQNSGVLKSGRIVKVISSVEGAYALTRAENAGIPSCVVSRKSSQSSKDYDDAILRELDECNAQLVILAGKRIKVTVFALAAAERHMDIQSKRDFVLTFC